MKQESLCVECNKPLGSGRSDRRFCSEKCRVIFHNAQKIKTHKEIRVIELELKKNREILKKLFDPGGVKLVSRERLLKAGFEFTYHTHHVITKTKSNEFIFCFDFGYREVMKDEYQIINAFK